MAQSHHGAELRLVPAVRAAQIHPNPASPPESDGPELQITIFQDSFVDYDGTAAQLYAECLIPDDFEWPVAAKEKCWQVGQFKYELMRVRPKGHKGPMRSWLELDSWSLRVRVVGRDYRWREIRLIHRKSDELRAQYRRLTTRDGAAEFEAKAQRHWAAIRDSAFQSFMASIRALAKPKRVRQPKISSPIALAKSQGASA